MVRTGRDSDGRMVLVLEVAVVLCGSCGGVGCGGCIEVVLIDVRGGVWRG